MLKVEIWSDIVCPFCYIGKRHFEEALKQFGETVDVSWRSFELQKDAPKIQKQNLATRLSEKYGKPLDWAIAMNEQMTEKALSVGLTFDLDHAVPTNSFDGHRLIHYADSVGRQDAMKERLLSAYFVEAKDISDHPTLIGLAKDVGLNTEAVAAMLKSEQFRDEVRADEQLATELEISGVPFFVVDQRFAISGAQPVEIFIETLQRAKAEEMKP